MTSFNEKIIAFVKNTHFDLIYQKLTTTSFD